MPGDPNRPVGEDFRDLFHVEDDEPWEGLERIAGGEMERELEAASPVAPSLQLAAALVHPTRAHALSVLRNGRRALASWHENSAGRPGNVAYHLNRPIELGCLELVQAEAVRGGRVFEHIYRATERGILLWRLSGCPQ